MAMEVIGYSYDADIYCVDCATQTEGEEVHPIFDTDEAGDTPTHCGGCGEYIDTAWHDSTIDYVVESLANYVVNRNGNIEVLDVWLEKLNWCGIPARDEAVRIAYDALRADQEMRTE